MVFNKKIIHGKLHKKGKKYFFLKKVKETSEQNQSATEYLSGRRFKTLSFRKRIKKNINIKQRANPFTETPIRDNIIVRTNNLEPPRCF